MVKRTPEKRYVVCIKNEGYRASLVVRCIYQRVPDREAGPRGLLRVIDESGEDYLYPAEFLVTIELPKAAGRAFAVVGMQPTVSAVTPPARKQAERPARG